MPAWRRTAWVVWAAVLWTFVADPPDLASFAENALLRSILLGVPVALWAARDGLRSLVAPSRLELAVLGAILAIAIAARWSAEALSWHGYDWLEILAPRVVKEPELSWYSNGFGVFMRTFFSLRPDFEWAVFTGNRVAGVLCVVAAWGLARLVLDEARGALAAAFVLAVLPLLVRLESSEAMQPIASLFSLLTLVGFAGHARTGLRSLLVVGAGSLVFAGLTRPEALVVAAAIGLPYLFHGAHVKEAFLAAVGSLVVAVPLTVLGALWMRDRMGGAGAFVATPIGMATSWLAALSTAGQPHGALAFAGLAGLWVGLARRRWLLVVPLVALLARVAVAGFDESFSNRWQLLVPEWPYLAIGLGSIVTWGAAWSARAGTGLLALVAIAVSVASVRAPLWRADFDQQAEYRFLRDAKVVRELGPALGLARAVREADEGMGAWFPTYRLPRDTPKWTLHELANGAARLPVVYYRGIWCWTPQRLAPACEAVESRFELEALEERPLVEPTYMGPGHPEGAKIGLYRVVRRR